MPSPLFFSACSARPLMTASLSSSRRLVWLRAAVFAVLLTIAAPGEADVLMGQGGLCVDARGAPTKQGLGLKMWQCHGRTRQVWAFVDGEIRGANRACFDAGKAVDDGYLAVTRQCDGRSSQRWAMDGNRVRHIDSGFCLSADSEDDDDLYGGGKAVSNGMRILLQPCHRRESQQWRWRINADFPGSPVQTPRHAPPPPDGYYPGGVESSAPNGQQPAGRGNTPPPPSGYFPNGDPNATTPGRAPAAAPRSLPDLPPTSRDGDCVVDKNGERWCRR